jgi:hypothetical protein
MKRLSTIHEVLDHLGGNAEVARLLECGQAAVSNWRMDGRAPAKYAYALHTALMERGLVGEPEVLGQIIPPGIKLHKSFGP